MKRLGLVLLLGLVSLGGCYTAPGPYGYAAPEETRYIARRQPELHPSNQWASHCAGGYDLCGRDGITQRQNGDSYSTR